MKMYRASAVCLAWSISAENTWNYWLTISCSNEASISTLLFWKWWRRPAGVKEVWHRAEVTIIAENWSWYWWRYDWLLKRNSEGGEAVTASRSYSETEEKVKLLDDDWRYGEKWLMKLFVKCLRPVGRYDDLMMCLETLEICWPIHVKLWCDISQWLSYSAMQKWPIGLCYVQWYSILPMMKSSERADDYYSDVSYWLSGD